MSTSAPDHDRQKQFGKPSPEGTGATQVGGDGQTKDTRENRSTIVLVCGFLALIPCGGWILGCIAWAMGAADLKRIERGEMPPEARDATRAGMILGIISVTYQLVVFILIITGVIPLPTRDDAFLH